MRSAAHLSDLYHLATTELGSLPVASGAIVKARKVVQALARWFLAVHFGVIPAGAQRAITAEEWDATRAAYKAQSR
jgi:hypothetical protein